MQKEKSSLTNFLQQMKFNLSMINIRDGTVVVINSVKKPGILSSNIQGSKSQAPGKYDPVLWNQEEALA